MAQSADQAAVSGVITVQQLELLVDKVEKKDRGIELFNLMIAARIGPKFATSLGMASGTSPVALSTSKYFPADQKMSQLAVS